MFALAAIISFFPAFEKPYDKIMNFVKPKKTFVAIGCFALFTVAALKVITGTISPFIYFRF
jgi:hypothetical protein